MIVMDWIDYFIFAAIGFGVGIEYTKYKANPKGFWKDWFN